MAARESEPSTGIVNASATHKPLTVTRIVVNMRRQKLYAYAGTVLVYEFNCVTGRPGTRPALAGTRS
jgi:hypothetical protein